MSQRDDSDLSLSLVRRAVKQSQPGWLHTFTAVFAAVMLAGLLLLAGLRLYFHWSVRDTLQSQPTERTR